MATIKTAAKAVKVSKPKYILMTPFDGAEKGITTYSFDDVLRDSTSATQDDPATTNIENEVSDAPIKTNTVLGTMTFSTTVEDMQADILKSFAGFDVDEVSGKAYAPAGYTDIYAEITVVLDNGLSGGEQKYLAYVFPKVQLNSKTILESLSSSMAGVAVSGTAQALEVTDGLKKYKTTYYVDYDYTLPEGL